MINLENISFDHCIKCTVCTAYCPVARVTHLYPGPKQSGPDTERLRIKNPNLLDESLKYCNNCKRCEIACPSDVKIADIIQNAKWKYSPKKFRLRDMLLSHTDLTGRIATFAGPVFNFFARLFPVKRLLDFFLNISSKKTLPEYARGTFHHWFNSCQSTQEDYDTRVVYFHGCYVNYNDHELGKDVLCVLNAMNIGVTLTNEKCCGVPLIANSFLSKARRNAAYNIKSLEKSIGGTNRKVVVSSSSCTFALKHEYPNLLEMDTSTISSHIEYITSYICKQFLQKNIPDMKPLNLTAAYHSPCHLERMGGVIYSVEVLKRIPGLELKLLHSECCGISGTYGFKKEFEQIAQDIGNDLFRQIKSLQPDIVITDCETCKWQIEMNTPYEVLHPVSVIARALSGNKFDLTV